MYDVIIIGRDLSSLVAALTASRRGLKTALISEGSQEAEYQAAGYTFPINPTPISGLGQGQTISRLLTEKCLLPDDPPQLLLMDPAFQVILPDHRIDLFHDRDKLVLDIIREFPQHEQEIRRFYNAVSKHGALIDRWISEDAAGTPTGLGRLIRMIRRFSTAMAARPSLIIRGNGNSCALKSVIEAQLSMLSYLDMGAFPFPISAAYLLTSPIRGVFYPSGGRNGWLDWLRKGVKDAGGELMDECSVMRIDTKPDICVDLEGSGAATTIRAKKLIVSTQWEKLNLLLFQQRTFRRMANRLDLNRPRAYPFCLQMGICGEGIPEKITPYIVVVPDGSKPPRDQNLLFLDVSLPGDTNRAPEGKRAVSATVYLKTSPLVLEDSELKVVAKTIIDSLDWFLPFLRENIDYINIEKSIAIARQSQEVINRKYHVQKRSIIAMNTLAPKTPLPNVILTGGIMRAGLGFEGEILSGMDAASLAGKEFQSHG